MERKLSIFYSSLETLCTQLNDTLYIFSLKFLSANEYNYLLTISRFEDLTPSTTWFQGDHTFSILFKHLTVVSHEKIQLFGCCGKVAVISPCHLYKACFLQFWIIQIKSQWVSSLDALAVALVSWPSSIPTPLESFLTWEVGSSKVDVFDVTIPIEPWEHVIYMTVGGFSFYYGKKFIVGICGSVHP